MKTAQEQRLEYTREVLHRRYGDYIRTDDIAKELNWSRGRATQWLSAYCRFGRVHPGTYRVDDFAEAVFENF